MPKAEQTSSRRMSGGKWITETEGKDYDSDSSLGVQERQRKAMAAVTSGAKPEVSEEEPEKGTIQHMAWKRRQDAQKSGQRKALEAMR